MMAVDPAARHVRQRGEVLRSDEHLGLEPAHLACRRCVMLDGAATHDLTQHRIDGQIVDIVDVLVAGEPAEDRLAPQGDDAAQPVVAGARVDEMLAHQLMKTQHVVELAVEQQTAIGADLGALELDANPAIETQPPALRPKPRSTWGMRAQVT